ncbi:ubiquinol-cytochrome C chaperone [Afipia sp. Root123D2]|uniref:ubiquinol-cytochrome C chaperone family protein n=1 Tax=Afipia sp. Root123D2 TaxID=1736436 RepID=UPI0006FA7A20|nr:ubiquinol-cytochrome C chaperone family protein [Afipia sp. Root123D2]KQW22789.1 ubiquinol-cytochrome C chaperone [Afipia sp. Root123D2]
MLWPFNRFRNPSLPSRGTIEAIYGMIVAQAREPAFYATLNVRDTVDGRFDMVVLHLWMVLRHLRTTDGGDSLSQGLFDRFCEDMDGNLREMGVGDLTVPKRMQAFGEAFYGRTAAYDLALAGGEDDLAQSIGRNVLNGAHPDSARLLARYVLAVVAALAPADGAALAAGTWHFPQPIVPQPAGAS